MLFDYKKNLSFIKPLIFFASFLFYSSFSFGVSTPSPAEVTNTKQIAQAKVEQKARNVVWNIVDSRDTDGTAFAIAPNLFVTNFHVIRYLLNDDSRNIKLLHSSGKSLSFKKIVKVDSRLDLAVIETHQAANHYIEIPFQQNLWNQDKFMEGLFMMAYPNGKLTKIEQIGQIKKMPYNYTFTTNRNYPEGASGSPVFNNKGQLAGVLFSGALNMVKIINPQQVSEFIYQNSNSLDCSKISSRSCILKEVERLHSIAKKSDSLAQFSLAYMFYSVKDFQKNYKKQAFYWAQQAANQGSVEAQHLIGSMYHAGHGTQINIGLAIDWYKKAAKQGCIISQKIIKTFVLRNGEEAIYKGGKNAMSLFSRPSYQGKGYHGDTPLHHAARNGQIQRVKDLIDSGIDPNLKDGLGNSPLHDAIAKGHKGIVKLLLIKGANPNLQNDFRETPLHHAITYGQKAIEDILIRRGADPQLKDAQGKRPTDYCKTAF